MGLDQLSQALNGQQQQQQPQTFGMGGWGSANGVWSPFMNYQSPWANQPAANNQWSNAAQFLTPSTSTPYLWNAWQNNPAAISGAYSPAAFSQFPLFYGNQSGIDPLSYLYGGASGAGQSSTPPPQQPAAAAASQPAASTLSLSQDQIAQLQQLLSQQSAPREFSPASPPDN